MTKRRFGVSLRSEVAEALEKIAKERGEDRSSIIERALIAHLTMEEHYSKRHLCTAMVIADDSKPDRSHYEEFSHIIVEHIHSHALGRCIDIFVLRGDSGDIDRFYRTIQARCRCAYILPLH